MRLRRKNVLVGISAGIAAYKIPVLIRLLKKEGAEVRVITTSEAQNFVTPLTLSTLSGNPVLSEFYDKNGSWNNHVELALWSDIFLLAPATLNTLAKMAHGICDNLLLATYFSMKKGKIYFAPAMDLDMYKHPANQDNINRLVANGNILIPATSGPLASGLEGEGRMEDPEQIVAILENYFTSKSPLSGKNIVITAGPTYEPIDPVRFIGNHSSGKMGYALANAAAQQGADVTLISGPTAGNTIHPNVSAVAVTTAAEMLAACMDVYANADALIMAAAVADFQSTEQAHQKIKKQARIPSLSLVPTPDILSKLGEEKKNQLLIGFALETQDALVNAQKKLSSKNLDAIVVNSLADDGAGFSHDTNKISFLQANKEAVHYTLKSKQEVALDVMDHLKTMFDES